MEALTYKTIDGQRLHLITHAIYDAFITTEATKTEAITAALYVISRQYVGEDPTAEDEIKKFITTASEWFATYFGAGGGKAN